MSTNRLTHLKRFVLGGIAAAGALIALPALATSVDWVQTYNNAGHTGENARETILTTANVRGLKLRWARRFAHEVRQFVLNDHYVVAKIPNDDGKTLDLWYLNYTNGETAWKVNVGPDVPGASGTIATGDLLIFTECGLTDSVGYNYSGICAYHKQDGTLAWQFSNPCNCMTEARVTAPLIYQKEVVFFQYFMGGTEGKEYAVAVNSMTGKVYASYPTGDINSLASAAPVEGHTRVFEVYFACGSSVCAVRHSNGGLTWQADLGAPIGGLTATNDGRLFANLCNGSSGLIAMDTKTGGTLWTHGVPECNNTPAAIASNKLYFVAADKKVHALDATSGKDLWSTAPGTASSVSLANGVMYVSGNGPAPGASAYNATNGKLLWKNEPHTSHYKPSPMIIDGRLYVANQACGGICSYGIHYQSNNH